MLEPLPPLYTAGLLAPLHGELMSVLRALGPAEWERPTIAGTWRVRDVAAHIADTSLRRLSADRDGHLPPPPAPIEGYADLVRFLNGLNATWVDVARRFSTRVLMELLDAACPAAARHLAELPPHGRATFPVSWAGENESQVWMDVGREYTEWWHHQMQIRDATGAPLLLDRGFGHPLLELSLRVLPRAYQAVPAQDGTAVVLVVDGDAGGAWSLVHEDEVWRVYRGAAPAPAASVRTDADTAWRLLYNALPAAAARARTTASGDDDLVAPLHGARSVMV
jgi:uncharacterized protein (TIGR03083 family)